MAHGRYVSGNARNAGRLTRFGYVTLTEGSVFGKDTGPIRSHEFHYFDVEAPGEAFLASKPSGKRSWRCIHSRDTLFAGSPICITTRIRRCRGHFWNAAKRGKTMFDYILPAVAAGFLLDLIFGDPVWLYHPVRLNRKADRTV